MHVDAMARAAKGKLDAVMDKPLAVRAPAGADLIEQPHRAFLEQPGADPAKHVVRRLPLKNDVVDAVGVQQLPEQQTRRSPRR